MAWTRGLTPELYEKVSARLVYQTFEQQKQHYPDIFNIDSTDMAFVDSFGMAGFGLFSLKPEGTAVNFDDPVQGDRKREVALTFALGFRWTDEAQEDEQYGMLSKFTADLGMSANYSQDLYAFTMVNDLFTGATFLGNPEGDGTRRALISTAHVPLRNPGTTQSNRLNPGVALSEAGLQSAILLFRLTQSEEERYVNNEPDQLVVHEENEFLAHKLLESEKVIDSNDNTINYVARLGIRIKRAPLITDTDSWFIQGKKHDMRWTNRRKLSSRSGTDTLTGDKMTLSSYRCLVHFAEYRGVVGSAP